MTVIGELQKTLQLVLQTLQSVSYNQAPGKVAISNCLAKSRLGTTSLGITIFLNLYMINNNATHINDQSILISMKKESIKKRYSVPNIQLILIECWDVEFPPLHTNDPIIPFPPSGPNDLVLLWSVLSRGIPGLV